MFVDSCSNKTLQLSINIKMDLEMQNLAVKQQAQRWITQIDNGKVKLVQRIENDAVVIAINKLADLCANVELVSDDQARLIVNAIKSR